MRWNAGASIWLGPWLSPLFVWSACKKAADRPDILLRPLFERITDSAQGTVLKGGGRP
jgi:hypothetical protein